MSQQQASLSVGAHVQRYRGALVRFFSKRLRHNADAEDLAQEALLRLMRHERIHEIEDVEAYLFRTASNLLRDRYRRDLTRRTAEQVSFESSGMEGKAPSEERVLEGRQALQAFVATLMEMPPRRRMVFVMHRFMGLSYGAIAMQLGISVGVVEKHMMKALLQCHCRLEPSWKP